MSSFPDAMTWPEPANRPTDGSNADAPVERAGDVLGPYTLLDMIGEGGFGAVWLAERREPFTQRVAIKIIKAGMDSRAVIARFEQERQALAIMDHPNVARVLDGGVTHPTLGLRPYFVMEYIRGEPLTDYCDRNKLSIRQRLELFIPVCEAVQHAHTKGIIHRDLKPSNVLVTTVEAGRLPGSTASRPSGSTTLSLLPIPKVIDFGIAKAVTSAIIDKTIHTENGQFIGTPEYMSPEQADMGSADLDTRTDVYSLGVMLYELLAGALPFDPVTLRAKGYLEIRRIIREVDPPRPSAKFTALARATLPRPRPVSHSANPSQHNPELPPTPDEIAAWRATSVHGLARELKQELEWIPLKALRKDRNERYRSPADLADDVRNYLDGRALVAGPETATYRLRKFVKRNRGVVLAAASFVLVLVLGIIGTSLGFLAAATRAEGEKNAKNDALAAKKDADDKRELAEAKTIEADRARRETEYGAYIANLIAADASLASNEPVLARAGLDACPEHLRGWEWRWLNARADTSLGVIRGHEGWVRFASFNPSGDQIVTASADKTARIWDSATLKEVAALRGHAAWVSTAFFSADGKRIVTAAADNTARVWDAVSGKELLALQGHTELVHTAQFNQRGDRIVTASYDKTARVWDATTGSVLAVMKGHEAEVRSAFFNAAGDTIVTASEDSTIRLWSAMTGAQLSIIRGHDNWVTCAQFSLDGRRIVSASGDNTARIWDSATGANIAVLRGHQDEVWHAAFDSTGDRVVTSSNDKTVRIWDAATGRELAVLRGHTSWIPSAEFSPSGDRVVSASADNTARVWSASTDTASTILRGHNDWVFSACYSPKEDLVLTASHDKTARIWDAATGKTLTVLRGHTELIHSAAFDPSAARVVTASEDHTVRTWDVASGRELAVFKGHESEVRSAVFNEPGDRILSASNDGTARIWDVASTKEITVFRGHRGAIRAANFSPSGDRVTTASEDRTAKVWDAATGGELATLKGHTNLVFFACFSPDGARVLTASEDNTARLWDAATGTELAVLRGHESWVTTARFSPAGDRIVTASGDSTARIWDASTARQLAVLRGHRGWLYSASFSPSGERVITASRDGTARVWDSVPYRDRSGFSGATKQPSAEARWRP